MNIGLLTHGSVGGSTQISLSEGIELCSCNLCSGVSSAFQMYVAAE